MRLDRTSFAKRLGGYVEATELPAQPILEGRLLRMVGLTLEAEGLLSICIQHELDHLLGKVFVEYLSPLKRNRVKSKMLKRQREARE